MEPVSHWLKNRRGTLEGKRLKQDYLGFCRHISGRWRIDCRWSVGASGTTATMRIGWISTSTSTRRLKGS
jgi:hypothetical protein